MAKTRKCLVIGLDCATPQLVFDEWGAALPITHRLLSRGIHGRLESTVPPITCPAWMCMVSSKDPGQLGLYGFRNRRDYTYTGLSIGTSLNMKEPVLWDLLGDHGLQSAVIGVPMTYPPRPLRGWLAASFLAPSTESDYTYPNEFKAEIAQVAPNYRIDVSDFRTDDKDRLLKCIYEMTEQRFALLKHIASTKSWDFFMFVEMGVDRLYHGFWRYGARDHRLFEPGNPYEDVLFEYHAHLDRLIGELLDLVDDDTIVVVASDHGAKSMVGGICINEWLIREGYLALKIAPSEPMRLETENIDWSATRAWGEGGYYGRIMLNVQGREPEGIVSPAEYEALRDELISGLEGLGDESGRHIGTRVFKPEEVYRAVKGIPPDLIVYFGDLDWRSAGTVGHGAVHIFENDTGPDDANHSQHGLFILYDPRSSGRGEILGASIHDIAPTILERMGLPIPADMIGKPLHA